MFIICLTFLVEGASSPQLILSSSNCPQFLKLLLSKSIYPHEV